MALLEALKDDGPAWNIRKKRVRTADLTAAVDLTGLPGDGQRIVLDDLVVSTGAVAVELFVEDENGSALHSELLPASFRGSLSTISKIVGPLEQKLRVRASAAVEISITCLYHNAAIAGLLDLGRDLLSFWPFDGDFLDAGSNGLDFTGRNGAGFAAGTGQTSALELVGASEQRADQPHDPLFAFGDSNVTISCWVNPASSGPSSTPVVLGKERAGAGVNKRTFVLDFRPSATESQWIMSADGTNVVRAINSLTTSFGTWYFLRADYDAAANLLTYRINETIVATGSHSGGFSTFADVELVVGAVYNTDSIDYINHWDGKIQGLGIWTRLLDSEEGLYLKNNPGVKPSDF